MLAMAHADGARDYGPTLTTVLDKINKTPHDTTKAIPYEIQIEKKGVDNLTAVTDKYRAELMGRHMRKILKANSNLKLNDRVRIRKPKVYTVIIKFAGARDNVNRKKSSTAQPTPLPRVVGLAGFMYYISVYCNNTSGDVSSFFFYRYNSVKNTPVRCFHKKFIVYIPLKKRNLSTPIICSRKRRKNSCPTV